MNWQDFQSSNAGAVHKAFLVIHEQDAGSVSSMNVSAGTLNKLTAASAGSTLSAVTASLRGAAPGMQSHVLQVQYNPSTLTLQANAQPIPFTYMMQNIESGIPNQDSRPPMVVLSVELMFDDMTPTDAFQMDKKRILETVASSVISAKKDGYTVQPQTDGLVAAILRPETRLVTFRWADMAFTGHLIEVQADYTMFSASGRPVRSKVRMNIAQQVESDADIQYWNNALEKRFVSGNDQTLKGSAQNMGSLINLNAF